MTKKHFIALADVMRRLGSRRDPQFLGTADDERGMLGQYIVTVGNLADFCEESSPRFNLQRWLLYQW